MKIEVAPKFHDITYFLATFYITNI